jgi:hypothetical protein
MVVFGRFCRAGRSDDWVIESPAFTCGGKKFTLRVMPCTGPSCAFLGLFLVHQCQELITAHNIDHTNLNVMYENSRVRASSMASRNLGTPTSTRLPLQNSAYTPLCFVDTMVAYTRSSHVGGGARTLGAACLNKTTRLCRFKPHEVVNANRRCHHRHMRRRHGWSAVSRLLQAIPARPRHVVDGS